MNHVDPTIAPVVERLLAAGLTPVPLCRPLADGSCTADWHERPCIRRGKRPLIEGYPSFAAQRPTGELVASWFSRFGDSNIGIVVPAGLCGIDADSPAAEAEVLALATGSLATPTREPRPGRGCVRLFAGPAERSVRPAVHIGNSQAIDILAPGGILVVPPSIHLAGHVYRWAPGLAPWEVAPMSLPERLAQLVLGDGREGLQPAPRDLGIPRANVNAIIGLIHSRSPLRRLWESVGKRRGDQTDSGFDFSLALALLRLRVPAADIAAALLVRPRSQPRTAGYCSRTVSRAVQALAHGGRR